MIKLKLFAGIILTFCLFLLASCGGGGGGGSATTAVIPATTKVLDSGTTAKIASVSSDQTTVAFSGTTTQLNNIKPGDTIVSGITSATPQGMLRKITAIQHNPDGTTTLLTASATLEEAVQKGLFSLKKEFSTSDIVSAKTLAKGVTSALQVSPGTFSVSLDKVVIYDADGNETTTGDQITASGTVSFKPTVEINGDIDGFTLKKFYFTVTGEETSDITVSATAPFLGLDKKKLIKEYDLGTQTIWIDSFPLPFPIVTSYTLGLYVGVTGDVSLGISANANQKTTITGGVKFENGTWVPVSDYKYEYGYLSPTVNAAASMKCYAGPELSMKFYGVAGPYANFHGFLLLQANPLNTPWWELFAGMEANAGAKVELLSGKISARYEINLLDRKESLARASTPYTAPVVPYSMSGTIHSGSSTGPALSGATVSIAGKTATTSSTGTFSIIGVPSGTYVFSVFKSGYDTYTIPAYYVGSNQTSLNFYLTQSTGPYYSMSGTIYAGSNLGSVLPGATVSIAGRTATTGSTGTYSITGIPAGTYAFSVSKSGYDTYTNPVYYVGSNQAGKNFYLTIISSSLVCPPSNGISLNGIQLYGTTSYQLSTTTANAIETATLTWEVYYQNIYYLPTGSYSGSLRARLWAVPYSFTGGTITNSYILGIFNPNFTGTGAYSSNQVYVGGYSTSPISSSVSGQNPPAGTYCVVVTIEEYNTKGGCSDPSGYCYDQWMQYAAPVIFR
ncbi:MAG TPA: carboxypeptidase-like regulatory domain-containing protein [Desulfuromonadaceae bacterium]